MLFIESQIKKLKYQKIIPIKNYDLIASMASQSDIFSAILPSGIWQDYKNFTVIKTIKSKVPIKLITYPQSPLRKDLSPLVKDLDRENSSLKHYRDVSF
jgi:hypothetical protein